MKYKVQVTVKAEVTYTVEVEERSESIAETAACAMWRTQLPDDFQVEKGYITDWEIEKIENLTWECTECDKEITGEESNRNHGLCDACEAEWKAEEAMKTQKVGNA